MNDWGQLAGWYYHHGGNGTRAFATGRGGVALHNPCPPDAHPCSAVGIDDRGRPEAAGLGLRFDGHAVDERAREDIARARWGRRDVLPRPEPWRTVRHPTYR